MATNIEQRVTSLKYFLKEYKIPVDDWGSGDRRTLEDLAREEIEGEASFHVENGRLQRRIQVAGITLYMIDGERIHVLKEDRQVFQDGRIRCRNLPNSLSEKLKGGELPTQAVLRSLSEELQFTPEGLQELDLWRVANKIETKESKGYKGLPTQTRLYIFDAVISNNNPCYKEEGYTEVQPDKTTYFRWQKVQTENLQPSVIV